MTKDELIEEVNERHRLTLESVNNVPVALWNDDRYSFWISTDSRINISTRVSSLADMRERITGLRKELGNYHLENYFLSYTGCVCVEYIFNGTRIRFDVFGNATEIVKELTDGKCHIEERKEQVIVCNA